MFDTFPGDAVTVSIQRIDLGSQKTEGHFNLTHGFSFNPVFWNTETNVSLS